MFECLKYNRFLNYHYSKVWDKYVFTILTIQIVHWHHYGVEIIIPNIKDTFKNVGRVWYTIEMPRWVFWLLVAIIVIIINWFLFKK
jgi:hypothetical protein